nr:hypothetical protein [Tanacetum cinerariifolium]
PGVLAAIGFLDRQAVADEVGRDSVPAPVVEREVDQRTGPAHQLAKVEVDASAHLLGVSGAAAQPAAHRGEALRDVIGAHADPGVS